MRQAMIQNRWVGLLVMGMLLLSGMSARAQTFPYPIGPSSWTNNYVSGVFPTDLYVEGASQWAMTTDAITALNPNVSTTGCLATNGAITTGSNITGTINNYITSLTQDGNDGDTEYTFEFCIDLNGCPRGTQSYLNWVMEDQYKSAVSAPTSAYPYYGIRWSTTLKDQATQLNGSSTISMSPGVAALPSVTAVVYGLYTHDSSNSQQTGWYRIYIRKFQNTIRVGIYDIILGGFLGVTADQGVVTSDSFVHQWTYSGGMYPFTYFHNFHSVMEFQTDRFKASMRAGMQVNTYSGATPIPKVYIGKIGYSPNAEMWWPKNTYVPNPADLPAGWSGPLGPICTRTAVTDTTMTIVAKAPINCTGVTYQWFQCPYTGTAAGPNGTETAVAGQTSLTLNVTGLTAGTWSPYYTLMATGTDLRGVVRTVRYPQCSFRTTNAGVRAATTFYIDSAAGTNGTGTSMSPFNSLANWTAAGISLIPGDTVKLVSGVGHATYQGPFVLQNACGTPTAPVTATSTDLTHPAVIVNVGSQYGSADGMVCLDCDWTGFVGINATGPGIQQIPGSGVNFEANGCTVNGAGYTATRTSVTGHGILFTATQNVWLPTMTGKYASTVNVPQFGDFSTPPSGGALKAWHGEDPMWNYRQGNFASACKVDGFYEGILIFAPGTHEAINPAAGGVSPTAASGSSVTPYQVNYRAGQEYLTVQNCVVRNCVHFGIASLGEYYHRDPTATANGDGNSQAIDPILDTIATDTNASGTDPYFAALYGRPGTFLRAEALNCGPSVNYTTNHYPLFKLSDYAFMRHHRNIFVLNCSNTNTPGDTVFATGGSGTDVVNGGAGIGPLGYTSILAGNTGFGMFLANADGGMMSGDCSYTGRCGLGPVTVMFFNVSHQLFYNLFIHNGQSRSGDGGSDSDNNCVEVVWKNVISTNNQKGYEVTSYTNAPYKVTLDHCTSFGDIASILILDGHRLNFLNCSFYDLQQPYPVQEKGAVTFVNCILTTNSASPLSTSSTKVRNSFNVFNSYLWNYGTGGVSPTVGMNVFNCKIQDPGLPNKGIAFDAPANPAGYPLMNTNANGTNAPSTAGFGFAWAQGFTNWIPTTTPTGGIDPAIAGVKRTPLMLSDIRGVVYTGTPVGAYGNGVASLFRRGSGPRAGSRSSAMLISPRIFQQLGCDPALTEELCAH